MKAMTPDQIPSFVQEVADTGCDIVAVMGGTGYLFGDADLSAEAYEAVAPKLIEIDQRYGSRQHLISEIAAYLVSIGRYSPPLIPNVASRSFR
jgi:hypothetical protein